MIPFVQFLPFLGLKLTGSASLLLRLLRLPRAFAAPGRATSGRERTVTVTREAEVEEPTIIRKVDASSLFTDSPAEVLNSDQLPVRDFSAPTSRGSTSTNISDQGFEQLSKLMQVAEPYFKSGVMDEIYPHIDYHQGASFIFLHSGEMRSPRKAPTVFSLFPGPVSY